MYLEQGCIWWSWIQFYLQFESFEKSQMAVETEGLHQQAKTMGFSSFVNANAKTSKNLFFLLISFLLSLLESLVWSAGDSRLSSLRLDWSSSCNTSVSFHFSPCLALLRFLPVEGNSTWYTLSMKLLAITHAKDSTLDTKVFESIFSYGCQRCNEIVWPLDVLESEFIT